MGEMIEKADERVQLKLRKLEDEKYEENEKEEEELSSSNT